MYNIKSFVGKYMGQILMAYVIIGIVFFIFRRKILRRYKNTFFDNINEDRIIGGYVRCMAFVTWFVFFIDLIINLIRNHASTDIGGALIGIVMLGVLSAAIGLSLIASSDTFDILLMAFVITIFSPILIPLAILAKCAAPSIPIIPENNSNIKKQSEKKQKISQYGITRDENGIMRGSVDQYGYYRDENGIVRGSVDEYGYYRDENGIVRGHIEKDGRRYDENGIYRGKVDSSGNYYDENGRYKGKCE